MIRSSCILRSLRLIRHGCLLTDSLESPRLENTAILSRWWTMPFRKC